MTLNAIAVSAPEYPIGRLGTNSLTSRDPVSLYNACRYSAFLAENRLGSWGDSNWAVPRKARGKHLLLMNSLSEEIAYFEELLARERPNLLLIGAMTMCFPGAIACAKVAKQMFGQDIFIVLGGRHASETIYTDRSRSRVHHHNGSPLRLMAESKIDNLFDLVISGEGEIVIAKVGEIIASQSTRRGSQALSEIVLEGLADTPGDWIAGYMNGDRIETLASKGVPFDRDRLPSPTKMFGIRSGFDIFPGSLTGHAFSDIGPGCVYDCGFCSERISVCGKPAQVETSGYRLFRQLKDVYDVVEEDAPGMRASAFVEDSILLGGLTAQMSRLCDALRGHPIDIRFGGQLTVDIALKQKTVIQSLVSTGLEYIFAGVETSDPSSVGGMSKDVGNSDWMTRTERMIDEYGSIGVKVGISILFGLGENQDQRLSLLKRISDWKAKYGSPIVASFNWAVQHPLKGNDNGAGYDYLNWAVGDPKYIDVFRDFGEASLIYHIPGIILPTIEELSEIQAAIQPFS